MQLPLGERQTVPSLIGAPASTQLVTDDDYRNALTQDGLSYGRDEDIAFMKAALDGVEWPKGITLRKHGEPIGKDDLRVLGYRANLILSRECLAILTAKGRKYPLDAAQFIVSALEGTKANKCRLFRTRQAMGANAMIQVIANNMAAGPCAACLAFATRSAPLSMEQLGPLPENPAPCPNAFGTGDSFMQKIE